MRRRSSLAIALGLLALAEALPAQGRAEPGLAPRPAGAPAAPAAVVVAPVASGAVVTVSLPIAAYSVRKPGALPRYRIEPAPGIRVFSELTGTVEVAPGEAPSVPVTFSVPRDYPAGSLTVAWITVTWPDGTGWAAELRTEVKPSYRLEISFLPVAGTVPPGGSARLGYRLLNRGNAEDTVMVRVDPGHGWAVRGNDPVRVVRRGEEVTGTVEVLVPREASAGERRLVQIAALGRGSAAHATVEVAVGRPRGAGRGSTRLPATLFVGATTPDPASPADAQVGFAFEAAGNVAKNTNLNMVFRSAPVEASVPTFAGILGGPRFRVSLERPAWSLAAGDVYVNTTALAGYYLAAQGGELRFRGGRMSGGVFAGRPFSTPGQAGAGHVAYATARGRSPFGTLGLALSSLEETRLVGGHRVFQTAVGHYELSTGHTRLTAEAGLVRSVSHEGREVVGPAADASYFYSTPRATLNAQLSTAPASPTGGDLGQQRAQLAASAKLLEGVRLTGSGFGTEVTSVDSGAVLRTTGANAGFSLGSRMRADILVNAVDYARGADLLRERRSLYTLLSLPLGPLWLDGGVEAGTITENDEARALRNVRSGVRWQGGVSSAWLQASYLQGEFPGKPLQVDLGGTLGGEDLRLEGVAGARLGEEDWRSTAHLWGGVTLGVFPGLALVVGTQYRPLAAGSAWNLSLGLRTRTTLAVPSLHAAALRGILFEDLNANGERDPDEKGIAGATMSWGSEQAVTDAAGLFVFPEAGPQGSGVEVDVTSLAPGLLVPPTATGPERRFRAIPVWRTAALRLHLYVDHDRDGVSGAQDEPAVGTLVVLTDAQGRRRDMTAAQDGTVRFNALPPGSYTLLVHRPPLPGRTLEPRKVELQLTPGGATEETLAVPYAPREVRIRNGTVVAAERPAPAPRVVAAPAAERAPAPVATAAPVAAPAPAPAPAAPAAAAPRIEKIEKVVTVPAPAPAAAAKAAPSVPTIARGMSESEVRAAFGEPVTSRTVGRWTYLFYLNGCGGRCGSDDVVMLEAGQVVTAVLRTPERRFVKGATP
jgi:hypothetical protein